MLPHLQIPPRAPRRFARAPVLALLAAAAAAAQAQSEGGAGATATPRALSIVPTFSATMTLTDNVNLSADNRRADLITQVSPGIAVTSNTRRVKGFLNYSVSGIVYARESSSNEIQHALNAVARIEAIEDWAFIDLTGSVSQELISAFGTQSRDSSAANSNRTQVANYSVSPYVRGRFGDVANYDARLTYSGSSSGASSAYNAATYEARARVGGATALRAVGWDVEGSRQAFENDSTGSSHSDRLRGVLSYTVNPELQVSVNAGRETENVSGVASQSYNTHGWGFSWIPIERTRVSVAREKRFFGNSHNYLVEHRTPRTVWRYNDSRNLSSGFSQFRISGQGTAYDLFFAQFASIEPDPVARAIRVTEFLRANGIPPNTVVLSGSLASATLVQRQQEFSFAWLGVRDTLTVSVSRSQGERADRVIVVNDDFANGNRLTQSGVSASLGHRLTPDSALSLTATAQRATGTTDNRTSRLDTVALTWSGRFGARTSGSVGARHQRSGGSATNYTESALIAVISMQF